jgi:hypothetical protein
VHADSLDHLDPETAGRLRSINGSRFVHSGPTLVRSNHQIGFERAIYVNAGAE